MRTRTRNVTPPGWKIQKLVCKFLGLLVAVLTIAGSANAANIVWVTENPAINSDWYTFLTNAGHTVTGYTNALVNPDPSAVDAPFTVAELNAFDLIITSGNNNSTGIADYKSVWQTVTAPILAMGAFSLDNADWSWFGNYGTAAATTASYLSTDPIFGSIDPTVTPLFSVNAQAANATINLSGVVLAASSDGSIQIARWAAGQAGAGARMFFAGKADGNPAPRDDFHLTTAGETVFLNAIESLINPTTEPSLLLTEPADNEVNVAAGNDLVATFDMPIKAGTNSISLYQSGGSLVESFDVATSVQLTWGVSSVTVDPTADLVSGTEYYVLIDATAVESSADGTPFAGISDATTWSFTIDGTPPAMASTWPVDGQVNVLPNTGLVLNFDEDVQAGSGNVTVHLTENASVVDTIDVATASISGSKVTLALSGDLPYGAALYINVPSGAFTDFSANDWAGISDSTSWNFTTVAADDTVIMWVTAARDGSVPAEWNTFLSNAGYAVAGFRGGTTPSVAETNTLNAADLVIFDSSNGSSESGTAAVWNGLIVPLINMGAYSTDDWGWMPNPGAAGTLTTTPTVNDSGDAAWSGVTVPLEGALFTDVRLAQPILSGNGGTTVASVGTDVAIARWPAGSFVAGGGERIFFGGNEAYSGAKNLTALGEQVFLNVIRSLLPPPPAGTVIIIE